MAIGVLQYNYRHHNLLLLRHYSKCFSPLSLQLPLHCYKSFWCLTNMSCGSCVIHQSFAGSITISPETVRTILHYESHFSFALDFEHWSAFGDHIWSKHLSFLSVVLPLNYFSFPLHKSFLVIFSVCSSTILIECFFLFLLFLKC